MKKLFLIIALFLACFKTPAQVNPSNYLATVVFAMTNSLGQPDTNYFRVVPIQNPVLANGSIITRGVPIRMYPNTNGICFTNFQQGFYQMTNAFLGAGIVFYVPANTNTYTVSTALPPPPGQLAISGFNTYALSGVLGLTTSNGTVTITPANGVGWVDIEMGAATNGSFTNLITIVQTNNTFVNTNISIFTSNSFFNNTVITNLNVTNEFVTLLTNNTFVNTNVLIQTSNSFFNNTVITNLFVTNENFNVSHGGTLIVTNASFTYVTNNNEITTNAYIQNITNNISYITNLFVTQLIGTTNSNFLLRTNDFGTNEGFVGTTKFYAAAGSTNPATLVDFFDWTGTNINAGFDGTNWFGTLTNLVAGANITLTPHGSGSNWNVTISSTSSSTNSSTTATNMYTYNTNAAGYIIVTNALQALNATANSVAIFDAAKQLTNAVNAHGVFTNTASGPGSFGLLQNTEIQNSTIGVNGTANQITSSSSTPALGGSTTLSIPNAFIAPGSVASVGNMTNQTLAPNQFVITDSHSGQTNTLNGGTLTNLNGQSLTGLVASVQWDFGAFGTNSAFNSNNVAFVTPGAASGSLQGSSGAPLLVLPLSSVQGGTNQFFEQWVMPPGMTNAIGTFSVDMLFATNTPSQRSNVITMVQATCNGAALGTALIVTNIAPTGTGWLSSNYSFGPLTIGGTPNVNATVQFQIQQWWPADNKVISNICWVQACRWTATNNAIQNGLLTGW